MSMLVAAAHQILKRNPCCGYLKFAVYHIFGHKSFDLDCLGLGRSSVKVQSMDHSTAILTGVQYFSDGLGTSGSPLTTKALLEYINRILQGASKLPVTTPTYPTTATFSPTQCLTPVIALSPGQLSQSSLQILIPTTQGRKSNTQQS